MHNALIGGFIIKPLESASRVADVIAQRGQTCRSVRCRATRDVDDSEALVSLAVGYVRSAWDVCNFTRTDSVTWVCLCEE